jgi:hypothetical protein
VKPLLSFFSSGIRTHKWDDLYRSLNKSSVSFELIMVGPKEPDYPLPKNFHYIHSNVKPAQCAEIAARNTTGELIMNTADDLIFSDNALNEMCSLYEKNASEGLIVSDRFTRRNKRYGDGYGRPYPSAFGDKMHRFLSTVELPLVPLNSMMSKNFWNTIGGIDRRFTALFWDLDNAMRTLEAGGKILFADNAITEEVMEKPSTIRRIINRILNKRKIGLYLEYGISIDRPLLDSFWVSTEQENQEDIYAVNDQNVSILKKRKKPFLPFEDKNLLTISQKPSGRW